MISKKLHLTLSTELEESTQTIGEQCLEYLSVLKREKPGSGTIASAGNALQKTIRGLGRLAGVSQHNLHVHYDSSTASGPVCYHNYRVVQSILEQF